MPRPIFYLRRRYSERSWLYHATGRDCVVTPQDDGTCDAQVAYHGRHSYVGHTYAFPTAGAAYAFARRFVRTGEIPPDIAPRNA